MNAPKALRTAILRQLVTTLREVSLVLVTLDSQAIDPPVQVNESINLLFVFLYRILKKLCVYIISAVKYKYLEFLIPFL